MIELRALRHEYNDVEELYNHVGKDKLIRFWGVYVLEEEEIDLTEGLLYVHDSITSKNKFKVECEGDGLVIVSFYLNTGVTLEKF